MKEHDCVKIDKLLSVSRPFDGIENVKRPPHIGDVGTIVHLTQNFCIVEKVDSAGYTVWLADFFC